MAFSKTNRSMKDLHVALKYIQGKLRDDEQIIITKEGFDIKLIKTKNDELVKDSDLNNVPRHIDGVDVEMLRKMYD